MAVAVPIIMSMTGASAAIGAAIGVSAGLVTAGAGLLTAATGIGSKIDKAAAGVFGSDLVNATNVLGTIALGAGLVPGTPGIMGGEVAGMDAAGTVADSGAAGTTAANPSGYMGPGSAGAGAATDTIIDGAGKVVTPQGGGTGLLSKVSGWIEGQPDRTKAALITVGGQAVAGAAQGYQRQKEIDKELAERRRRESIYNVGHAGTINYGPRTGVLAKVGGN